MFDGHFLLNLLGRSLLAFYFLKAGINNAYNWGKVRNLIKSKRVPLPDLVLPLVIFVEIVGGLALIFNFYVQIAAFALIFFTLITNTLICNYWTMEGIQKRNVSFVFYANIAVVGALLLIMTMQRGVL